MRMRSARSGTTPMGGRDGIRTTFSWWRGGLCFVYVRCARLMARLASLREILEGFGGSSNIVATEFCAKL